MIDGTGYSRPFSGPWKIKRHTSGNCRIEDRNGRVICWVYQKGHDTQNHKIDGGARDLHCGRHITECDACGIPSFNFLRFAGLITYNYETEDGTPEEVDRQDVVIFRDRVFWPCE